MVNLKKIDLTKQSSFDLLKTNPGTPIIKQTLLNDIGSLANYFNIPIVPALDYLVPIGNTPFMASPDDPIGSTDCVNDPGSLLCAGGSLGMADVGVGGGAFGFNFAIVLDNCNIGVEVSYTIGFITFPPLQVVYHSNDPSCVPQVLEEEVTESDIILPDLDGEFWLAIIPSLTYSKVPILNQDLTLRYTEVTATCKLTNVDIHARNNTCVALTFTSTLTGSYAKAHVVANINNLLQPTELGSRSFYDPPYENPNFPGYSFSGAQGKASIQSNGVYYQENATSTRTIYIYKYGLNAQFNFNNYKTSILTNGGHYSVGFAGSYFHSDPQVVYSRRGQPPQDPLDFYFSGNGFVFVNEAAYLTPAGKAQLIEQFKNRAIEREVNVNWVSSDDGRIFGAGGTFQDGLGSGQTSKAFYSQAYETVGVGVYSQRYMVLHGSFSTPLPPPPPLPMECCPAPFDPALLNLILANQIKMMNAIGVNEFPAKLPKRLIYPGGTGEETMDSLVEFMGYQVRQVDKAVGYLPQKIKVLDTNSAMAGNQTVEVNIHSFADFARETLQYLIDTEGDEDTLANIAVRILYECGAIHQAVIQGNAMMDATVEHLDFKEKWVEIKVPFAFDPYAGQQGKKAGFGTSAKDPIPLTEEELEKLMPDLLKETIVKIRILKNDQKRTINDILLEITKDARTAAAGASEAGTPKRFEEIVQAAQAALQLQSAITRNNVRKGITSGDLRTRKPPKK